VEIRSLVRVYVLNLLTVQGILGSFMARARNGAEELVSVTESSVGTGPVLSPVNESRADREWRGKGRLFCNLQR
jgi:hypothetical protein